MIQQQDKQSEFQGKNILDINEKDLLGFLAYYEVKNNIKSLTPHFYDWDINTRQNRQEYINKKYTVDNTPQSQMLVQSRANTVNSQKTSKKSIKQKVQNVKKLDISMIKISQKQLKSRQDPQNLMQIDNKNNIRFTFLPCNIPQISNVRNEEGFIETKNLERKNNDYNMQQNQQQMDIPDQKNRQESYIVNLPMIEKSSNKKLYYGDNKPQIDILNSFMKEPIKKKQSISSRIEVMIPGRVDINSHKNHKTQFCRTKFMKDKIQTPAHTQKKQSQSFQRNEYKNKADNESQIQFNIHKQRIENKLNQKEQFATPQRCDDTNKETNRSKSRSIKKNKHIKASNLFNPLPKIYKLPVPYTAIQQKNNPDDQLIQFSQVNHEPITHKYYRQQIMNNRNGHTVFPVKRATNIVQNQLPVEDYDSIFDTPKKQQQYQESMGNIEQIILDKNKGKNQDYEQNKFDDAYDVLQGFSIPLHHLKNIIQKEKNSMTGSINNRIDKNDQSKIKQAQPDSQSRYNHNKTSKQAILSQQRHERIYHQKGNGKKSTRKPIFSQVQNQFPSDDKFILANTDDSDYTDDEIKMLLAAKGNKYKQAIVKQYIKLQRTQNSL